MESLCYSALNLVLLRQGLLRRGFLFQTWGDYVVYV